MSTVLFRTQSLGYEGHETAETKLKKLEDYKKLLKKENKITGTKEVTNRRGSFIEITYQEK